MRKLTVLLGLSLIATGLAVTQVEATAPKPGTSCSKLNQAQVSGGYTYTCIKSGKKLVWSKGVKVAAPAPVASPTPTPSPLPSQEAKPQILNPNQPQPGDSCSNPSASGVTVYDGILYCVQVSNGSFKYIEHYSVDPVIANPTSPQGIEACETPDLRGNIPSQMSILRIAHDSPVPSGIQLKHLGAINILVVPIDFSDAVGTVAPSTLYGSDFATLADWYSDFSNGKLKVTIDLKNKWFRAPLTAANYDPALWQTNDPQTQFKLIQQYVDLTSSEVDYSKADTVVFVYPKSASTSGGYLNLWSDSVMAQGKSANFSVLSSIGTANKYEPFWQWLGHEMLHQMGLAMHLPANPPGWGIEWGRYSYSEALLPWNQMILDWLNPDQYYCVNAADLVAAKITLVPQESDKPGVRTVFVRVSNTEVLMVVSYRNGKWAYETPNSFYGTMVALIDTSKQVDMSGENGDDNFDGVKYVKPGVWLHPKNSITPDMSWTNQHTGDWGALMYLGDAITYKGTKIQLVDSNNFDTVLVTKG